MNLKVLIVSLIFMAFCGGILQPVTTNLEFTSTSLSISEIIEKFYVKNQINFDIILDKSGSFDVIYSGILEQNEEKFSNKLRMSKIENENSKPKVALKKSAILFLDSCINYRNIHFTYYLDNSFPRPLKFLIYVENCGLDIMKNNIREFISVQKQLAYRGMLENYEILLIKDENFLHFATIEWFTQLSCNSPQLIILNSFNITSKKWSKKLENYDNFRNFHGCSLTMVINGVNDETIWSKIDSNDKELTNAGLTPTVFKIMSKLFNFVPDFNSNNPNIDETICFHVYRLETLLSWPVHMTSSFLESRDIILTTPGELYTPYEKLLLPFDEITWILLASTFLIAFSAIFIINRMSKFIQIRIYGENVSTPSLNVISTFFGISQLKVPVKNSPRFILINFIFFCLIFRTCYQSKLFEFMTSEPRRPPPKTIEDLYDKNFILYCVHDLYCDVIKKTIEDEQDKWPHIERINLEDYYIHLITQSQNASAKLSLMIPSIQLQSHEIRSKAKLNWNQLKDFSVQVSQLGFMLWANHFFYEILDLVTQGLTSAGIIIKIIEERIGTKYKCLIVKNAEILTVKKLSFGFEIWLGFCGLSIGCFLVEILSCGLEKRSGYVMDVGKTRKIKFEKVYPILNKCVGSTNANDVERVYLGSNDVFRIKKSFQNMGNRSKSIQYI